MAINETKTQQDVAFPRLDDAEIKALKRIGTTRRLQDGETLFEIGEQPDGIFVVLSGAIEIICTV